MRHARAPHRHTRRWLTALALLSSGVLRTATAESAPPAPAPFALRLARSADGLQFKDSGGILVRRGASPTVVVLPGGNVLALFDHSTPDTPAADTVIASSHSADGGHTWSPATWIRFRGDLADRLRPRRSSAVLSKRGYLRLFFIGDHPQARRRGSTQPARPVPAVLYSAVSRDGHTFRIDPRVRIRLDGLDTPTVVAATHEDRFHLFVAEADDPGADAHGPIAHFVSHDGHQFVALRDIETDDGWRPASIVSVDRAMRAYGTLPTGLASRASTDGHIWLREPSAKLLGSDAAHTAADPAVTRLPDGSYLMVYVTPLDEPLATDAGLIDTTFAADDRPPDEAAVFFDEPLDTDMESAAPASTGPDAARVAVTADAAEPTGEEKAQSGTPSEPEHPGVAATTGPAPFVVDTAATLAAVDADGFAPRPDFRVQMDYPTWYQQFALGNPPDNAYEAYVTFMPGTGETDRWEAWPKFVNMFTGDRHEGPPGPWDPAEHPEWEQSNALAQSYIAQFGDASLHAGYAAPFVVSDYDGDIADGYPLLAGFLLPSLGAHRDMVRVTLADAWRIEEGNVSPERMLDAWRTTLRAASHLAQGATLIEQLVSLAEQSEIQQTAMRALQHNVLPPERLDEALDILRDLDRQDRDPLDLLRGEHGMTMDAVQYLFTPPTPDGHPRLNPKRLKTFTGWINDNDDLVARLKTMTDDDAYAAADALDVYYRQLGELMRIGYPAVREADLNALVERFVDISPLVELLAPALGRIHYLRARNDASRRATQLVCALHTFEARHGRWPRSLEELPPEVGGTMRIDPFSGEYFRYEVTEDGPIVYSVSENGIDDGGIHAPHRFAGPGAEAESADHVFWPPRP